MQHQGPTMGQRFQQFSMSFASGCMIGFVAVGASGIMSGHGFNKQQAIQSGLFMGIVIGFGSMVRN